MTYLLRRIVFVLLAGLLLLPLTAFSDQGKVLKVIDGDTFLAEVAGKGGAETIEVNLRCSDAPVIDSLFGKESKQFLEKLLGASGQISYKVQAFCGSTRCVEALAYIPDPESVETVYLNTLMIEAGMARNNSCRGVFAAAETQAKSAKKGIWSTSKRISFVEAQPVAEAKPATTTASAPKPAQPQEMAPAIVKYDRVERTVTLKSQKLSLTRIVKALDAVAPTPINIYLQEEQYMAVNLEKVHWYKALQYIVENADLKQVNMDGNVDLYTRLFYYKFVAPYLKIAGNVGVYMSAGSSVPKEPIEDDGTTRYVFINEFENSAEVAQQYKATKERNQSSGYIQVHEGSTKAPVSDYGTFARSGQQNPTRVAAVEPVKEAAPAPAPVPVQKPTIERAPLKPYSGEPVAAAEEEVQVAAVPVKKPVEPLTLVEQVVPQVTVAEKPLVKPAEAPATPTVETPAPVPAEKLSTVSPAQAETKPDEKPETAAQADVPAPMQQPAVASSPDTPVQIEFSPFQAAALVLIVLIIVIVCYYLTKTAGAKAAKAEQHGEPDELIEKATNLDLDADAQVDKAYEEEIFDKLEHAGDAEEEPDAGEASAASVEAAADETSDTAKEDFVPEEASAPAEVTNTPVSAEETDANDVAATEKFKPKPISGAKKRIKTKLSNEGDFTVPVEDYREVINGPEREPRKICLFEVKCSHNNESFTGIGLDISSGGLFVDSKEKLDIGTVIELEFKLFEDVEESIRCRGAVTWYNQRPDPIKPDYPNGFGVRFLEVESATIAMIEDFLKPDEGGFMEQLDKGDS